MLYILYVRILKILHFKLFIKKKWKKIFNILKGISKDARIRNSLLPLYS